MSDFIFLKIKSSPINWLSGSCISMAFFVCFEKYMDFANPYTWDDELHALNQTTVYASFTEVLILNK